VSELREKAIAKFNQMWQKAVPTGGTLPTRQQMEAAIPKELDAIADVVLAYRPKPKTKAAKKRTRKAKREAAARV